MNSKCLPSLFPLNAPPAARGFSLVEILTTLSLVGILVAIAIPHVGTAKVAASNTKLIADVTVLNEAISLYLAEGGNLDDVTDAEQVIDRLKTKTRDEDVRRHVGPVTGRLVDVRLSARNLNKSERDSDLPRAVWDPTLQKFTIASTGSGIGAFYFDDDKAAKTESTETRNLSNVLYNGDDGWVWAWGPRIAGVPVSPSSFLLNPPSGPSGWTPPTSSTPPSSSPPPPAPPATSSTPPVPTRLPTPTILPLGGAFTVDRFPSSIMVGSGGAPAGSSILQYRTNSGTWAEYVSNFSVTSGTRVYARNISLNPELYLDSGEDTEIYFQLVDYFTGSVTPEWKNMQGQSGGGLVELISNLLPDNVIANYGKPTKSTEPPNSLGFRRSAFSGVPPDTDFKLGVIDYFNGTVSNGTAATSIDLHLDLSLTKPTTKTGEIKINLGLLSTSNSDDKKESADYAKLNNPITDFTLQMGGITYTLQVKFANIAVTEGWTDGNTLHVFEGSKGSADLIGRFVSSY